MVNLCKLKEKCFCAILDIEQRDHMGNLFYTRQYVSEIKTVNGNQYVLMGCGLDVADIFSYCDDDNCRYYLELLKRIDSDNGNDRDFKIMILEKTLNEIGVLD